MREHEREYELVEQLLSMIDDRDDVEIREQYGKFLDEYVRVSSDRAGWRARRFSEEPYVLYLICL